MAFYGNFEGTLKSTILIGKGGIKLDSTSQKLNVYDSSGILTNIRIADAVGLTDAVTYNQFQGLVHSLGSASTKNESYFATSAQGLKADSAVQPLNNISILTNDAGYLVKSVADTYYATVSQGSKADSALQSGNNVSLLINDAGYLVKTVADTYYSLITHSHSLLDTSTSANTPSTLVLRDGSGNSHLNVLGNASTASKLETSRNITIQGDINAVIPFDGSIDLNITGTFSNTGVVAGTYNSSSGYYPFTVDSKGRITSVGSLIPISSAWSSITATPSTLSGYGITDAQSLNANLTSVSSLSNIVTGLVKFTNGVASLDTSVYLTSNQNITVTGDATGSGTTSIALTLAASGVTSGTYNNSSTAITPIVVDSKGRITATGTKVTITPAFSSITSKPTTISGYGITDAQRLNANLTSISGLSTSSTGYIVMTNGVASLSASSGSSAITLDASHNYKGTDSELAANTTGTNSIAIGYQSLNANTIGGYNVSLGSEALKTNVAGSGSVAVGYRSQFYANNSGTEWTNYNTSVGYQALYGSSTPENNIGNYNTAIGYQSLNSNSSGSDNTAIGFNTLFSNTSGTNNTVIGSASMIYNTTGAYNTAIGIQNLQNNNTGTYNIAIGGGGVCSNNTTGAFNIGIGASANATNSTSDCNIAIGYQALYSNTAASNTSIGHQSLYYSDSGGYNTAVGYMSLYNLSTGSNNTVLGFQGFKTVTTGSNNTGIGYGVTAFADASYSTAIGAAASVTTSNTVVLGRTTDVTVIGATGNNGSGNKLQVSGTIGCTTPTVGDNSTKVATTAFVKTALGAYVAPNKMSLNTQTGTSYTLVLADYTSALMVEMNNAAANTVTIPPNSSVAFPVGATIPIRQYGAGQTTIVAGSGVTIRNAYATLKIAAQYGLVHVHQRATNEWVIEGYLAAS